MILRLILLAKVFTSCCKFRYNAFIMMLNPLPSPFMYTPAWSG